MGDGNVNHYRLEGGSFGPSSIHNRLSSCNGGRSFESDFWADIARD